MTTKQIDEAICEIVGRKANFSSDLNAMHEAEKMMMDRGDDWGTYCDMLMDISVKRGGGYQNAEMVIHASAARRAEAFLRTLSLWDDTK